MKHAIGMCKDVKQTFIAGQACEIPFKVTLGLHFTLLKDMDILALGLVVQ